MCVIFLCESVLKSFSSSIKKIMGKSLKILRSDTYCSVNYLVVITNILARHSYHTKETLLDIHCICIYG